MSPFPCDYDPDCFNEDNQVEEERKVVLDIVEIELQFFRGVLDGGAVVIANLGPTRYPWLDAVPDCVERDFPSQLVNEAGARAAGQPGSFHPSGR